MPSLLSEPQDYSDRLLGHKINNTPVLDFVFSAWFESFRKPGSTQFDYGKHIKKPFELKRKGYIGVFDVWSGTGWHQLTASEGPFTHKLRPRVGSRRERRRTPRDEWRQSRGV